MSLDTKRAEIQAYAAPPPSRARSLARPLVLMIPLVPDSYRLEEKAQMKEEALKKSELMLEEDAMRFDAFLKDNDRKAHDALKKCVCSLSCCDLQTDSAAPCLV